MIPPNTFDQLLNQAGHSFKLVHWKLTDQENLLQFVKRVSGAQVEKLIAKLKDRGKAEIKFIPPKMLLRNKLTTPQSNQLK